LKTFAKEFLENMSDEEKVEFLKGLNPELVWRMAEGNPPQDLKADVQGGGVIRIAKEIADKYGL
jgi:hypothetical protein